jgi:glycosyltransferase involved in cell wall biosynthesis
VRIALVSPGYPPAAGGVEVVVAQTARALARAGASVEVLAQEHRHGLPRVVEDDGVMIRRFATSPSRTYPVAPGLWRYLQRHQTKYDVVHGHSYHCAVAAGAALVLRAHRDGPRFVYSPHYHGGGHTTVSSLIHHAYRPVGRAVFSRAATVVCVSRAEAELVAQHFPAVAARIAVVPNAVDTAALAAAEPWPQQPETVLSVGRLERYKRIDRLLGAFRQVPAPARLVVIGDGPDRERLEKLAAQYGLIERVRFLGRVCDADLARWLRTARALCSLSEHEAFGLAPAEALAAGASVVLSDIPAHAELVGNIGTLIGERDDDAQIATALVSALEQGSEEPCATAAGWDQAAAALLGIYEHTLTVDDCGSTEGAAW